MQGMNKRQATLAVFRDPQLAAIQREGTPYRPWVLISLRYDESSSHHHVLWLLGYSHHGIIIFPTNRYSLSASYR